MNNRRRKGKRKYEYLHNNKGTLYLEYTLRVQEAVSKFEKKTKMLMICGPCISANNDFIQMGSILLQI